MSVITLESQSFEKGWVTLVPPHLLEDGATPNVQNIDFSESYGRLTKRKGHSILFTARTGASDICGLFEFINSGGSTYIMAASDDDVYNVTGAGTYTSIFNSGSMNGAVTSFVAFNDLAIFVNKNITTQKWTGTGSSANLLGSPPANVLCVEKHKSRVWMANSSAGKSRLHYCARDNAEDWTTADDAGFIDVSPNDGDEITGLCSVGNTLIVFKKQSTWVVHGYSPDTFTMKQISPAIGCTSQKTIVRADTFCIFLSQEGVYAGSPSGVTLLSHNIKPTVDAMTDSAKLIACAGKLRTQYWLCLDTNADGQNDSCYVLDYVLGVWGKYTNKTEKVFCRRNDGSLISGGDESDLIRKHDDTENDSGSAITAIWDSRDYDFDNFTSEKNLQHVSVVAKPISSKAIVVSHLIDGVEQATTMTYDLTRAGGYDRVYLRKGFPSASHAPYIRIRFTNSQTDARIEIYAYSIEASVQERRRS